MRALRITMMAFGPFAGEEIVDFEEIAGTSLLLIHGPTGSGKTTILDAMCFALFGDTSGAEREGRQMRCDSAPLDLPTSVRYEFALGSKVYCVERRPEQVRPAKRGGGTATDAHTATLWDRSEASSKEEEGKVLASGAAKVKKAVADLFGFDSDQFRQVVMLPQGQFRKLLTAESREKEKILQRLFQSSHYSKLERALAERASKLRRAFQDDEVAMNTLLTHEETTSVEELRALIASAAEEHERALKELPAFKTQSEAATSALASARADELLLREREAAEVTLRGLKAQESEIETLRSRLALVKNALPLIPRADGVSTRQQEAAAAAEACSQATSERAASDKARGIAVAALEVQEARSDERDALRKQCAELDSMRGSVQRLDEAREKSNALALVINEQVAGHGEAAKAVSSLELNLKQALEARQADQQQASRSEALELSLGRDRATLKKRSEFQRVEVERKETTNKHQAAGEALKKTATELEQQEQSLVQLEFRWQTGQAGALARELRDGDACPVCGSEEHPKPASAGEALPSEEEIESVRTSLREARAELAAWQEQEASYRAQLRTEEARRSNLMLELGDAADSTLEELQEQVAKQEAELASALAAKARGAEAAKAVTAAELALANATETLEKLTTALTERRIQAASLSGSEQELESEIPAHLRLPGSLALAKARADEQLQELTQKLETARRSAKEASENFAASEARCVSAKSAATLAATKASDAAMEFESHRVKAGFADLVSFQSAAAEAPEIPEWEARIKKHEGELQAAIDRLDRAEEAAKGKVRANLEELSAHAESTSAALSLQIGRETDTKNRRDRLQKVEREHEAIREGVAKQEGEWRVVASVSDLANGKVPPKVSFQRFVLGALLDEVLLAASERLSRMSEGRYGLQRQVENAHKGKASGLDLEVMDAYTGTPRSVSTLSGGESFLAALALSLGLADVVQSFSGGIRLDTLLIDEGFGTLDSDALDLALDTLTSLNAEGRLVGIISHVDELRSRIPTRLEVRKGPSGSSTRFVGN